MNYSFITVLLMSLYIHLNPVANGIENFFLKLATCYKVHLPSHPGNPRVQVVKGLVWILRKESLVFLLLQSCQ